MGEQKSKEAQLGFKRLMEMGIMPNLIACRAAHPVKESVKEKISMYTNVPMRRVVSMHDVESIYTIPESLRESGLDREVLTLLDLHDRTNQRLEDQNRQTWSWFSPSGRWSRENATKHDWWIRIPLSAWWSKISIPPAVARFESNALTQRSHRRSGATFLRQRGTSA